jgi:hypothetical protein
MREERLDGERGTKSDHERRLCESRREEWEAEKAGLGKKGAWTST